jgi:hypothetical protein
MADLSRPQRLRRIAENLRSIPKELEQSSARSRGVLAGKFLLQALDLGDFYSTEYLRLKAQLASDMARASEYSDDVVWESVWQVAVHLLFAGEVDPDAAYGRIADLIEEEAVDLEKAARIAKPEQGEENGGERAADPSDCLLTGPRVTKVFISYAHSSAEHRQTVSSLVETLREKGLTVAVDTDVTTPQGPEEGWPRWMKRQIKDADWVLMFFDESYRRRLDGAEEPDRGLGATWEGAIITHHFCRDSTKNEKFIPLLADGASTDLIPDELFGYTRYFIPTQAIELAAALRQSPS